MYARRLLLLSAILLLGLSIPVIAVVRASMVRGASAREAAEDNLVLTTWLPTGRGQILDRKGRVLATDQPSYDIAVEYPVITGQWAFAQAARRAKRTNKELWKKLSPLEREALVQAALPEFAGRLEEGWRQLSSITGVPISEIEARRSAVIEQVAKQAATVWERQRLVIQEQLERGRELAEDVALSEVDSKPIREQTTPHVILRGVDDRVIFELRSMVMQTGKRGADHVGEDGQATLLLPGLRIIDTSTRQYPFDHIEVALDRASFPGPTKSKTPLKVEVDGAAIHVVGWMRNRLYKEDLDKRPRIMADGTVDRGYYAEGDAIGSFGIEASAEAELRGLRGLRVEQLDTGTVTADPPVRGRDIKLTIDAALQARVQALASAEAGLTVVQPWHKNKAAQIGEHLHAAVAVVEIDSGDVLALVSTPSFSREQLADDPAAVFDDEVNLPLLNRAVARPYPPGSIVKPLMLAAACADGVFEASRTLDCTGHLLPDQKNLFRCWIYKPPLSTTHTAVLGHPLDASEAVMVSCNIYFYNVGRALGPERIVRWYEAFGCGANAIRPRLGIGDQFAGAAGPQIKAPDSDQAEMLGEDLARSPLRPSAEPRRGVSPSEAILMGIGQGPVAWTPLHAADAYATLARYGRRIVPRMRFDGEQTVMDIGLDRAAVTIGLRGLERAVGEQLGTGHHIQVEGTRTGQENTFNVPGVRIWGKSGTADSGLKARDASGAIVREVSGQAASIDHSWFVVLVGPEGEGKEGRPKFAVAVLVENGGSGGRVAGPLCNQVLHALRAEGYF